MLLDSHLVERFHSLHRQRLSGGLACVGEGFSLEICLVEGNPAAVDIGTDLELAFAEACTTYHKIDENGQAELRAAIAGGAKARDYLVSRQLVSDAEADQVAQAMVEDHLCRCFRGPCARIDFVPGKGPDQFAIGKTAVRMRIEVEALIRTCDQQVTEQVAVDREIGGWAEVFALSEEEHVSGQLSEYEKMVLNFIDGKATVEQIAELCRDSSYNLARVLRSLVAKRVIHRVERSGVRPAISPTPGPQPAVATASTGPRQVDITPYHAPRVPERSRAVVMAGLIALLAISVGVAILVVQYNQKQDRLRRDEGEVMQKVAARIWSEARSTVARLRREAGNEIGAIQLVEGLAQRVEAAITAESVAIQALIADEEFDAARIRIAALPEDNGLGKALRAAIEEVHEDATALAGEVRSRLGSGDVAGALAAIDAAEPKRRGTGEGELSLWRTAALAEARNDTRPLPGRMAALAQVRQSRPDAATEELLATLEAQLQAQVQQAIARLDELERLAVAGAHVEAAAELAKLGGSTAAAGAEIEARSSRVIEAVRRAAAELGQVERLALEAIAAGEDAEVLDARRAAVAGAVRVRPQASGRERLERILGALAACAATATRTIADRAEEALALAEQVPANDGGLAEALRQRASALREIESAARLALEDARRMGRSGDWDGAVVALEQLVKKSTWRLTMVRQEAEQELDLARNRAARRQQLRGELEENLRRGDIAACERIAREIGLAYLPLVVSSAPDGAEVVDGAGKVLGRTPLVLDVTADQRVDLQLTLRRPGFDPVTVRGSAAEGGWRIGAALQRVPLVKRMLAHPLTARPVVVAGTLWLADRGRAVGFASPAAVPVSHPIDAAALSEPVFAPVSAVGDRLLLATRERLALRLDAGLSRVPLPAGTDLGLVGYRSQVVLDRESTILAGRDGRLYAIDGSSRPVWQGEAGGAFAASPLLNGEDLLLVRADGTLQKVAAEDGHLVASIALPGPVLAAWAGAGVVAGVTADAVWSWDGGVPVIAKLPEPILSGGPGTVVTATGKVLLHAGESWTEVGRLDPRPQPGRIAGALSWAGHGVVATGSVLQVCGADGFRLDAGSELLPPVLWGDVLVVASLEGGVWMFKP